MKKLHSKSYAESCNILRLIRGDINRDYSIGYDFHSPENWYPVYTKQKMAALNKRIEAFIKYLDRYVKPSDNEDIHGAVAYFTSGIISSAINCETWALKEDQGIYTKLNHKRDYRKSFYHVLYVLEGNLDYFSDRWCYSRVFAFKMHWSLVMSAFRTHMYFLENPE
jgi:hypothetical protein